MYILSRERHDGRYDYVSDLPGHGGKDWGYTTEITKAQAVSDYWKRRFLADMRYISAKNPLAIAVITKEEHAQRRLTEANELAVLR